MALRYNGIEFLDVNTQTHVMGPVKDPSGSDQLFTEIHLRARSIINPAYTPSVPSDYDGGPQKTLARIRHMLTAPRKPLYYDTISLPGGTSTSPIINLPDGRDDANGPWPDANAFEIVYTTEGTYEVAWSCVVRIKDCGESLPGPTSPLSLRWEDSITFDETWRATYQRQGTLIISSRQQRDIDWFRRNKLTLPIVSGFQRVSSKYLCSRDGLKCEFSFTDKQIRWAPPFPAVDMQIVQSETAPLIGGMKKGMVAVQLTGIQGANIISLSKIALHVMKARVWAASPLGINSKGEGTVLGVANLETVENTSTAIVKATCSYKVQPTQVRVNNNINRVSNWVDVLGGAVPGGGALIKLGSIIGRKLSGTPPPPPAQPTQQGKNPTFDPIFPWVGFGTSPTGPTNPNGYAAWADPNAVIGGPPAGVGLAQSISLFAALLNDPCGSKVSPTPYATSGSALGSVADLVQTTLQQSEQASTPDEKELTQTGSVLGALTDQVFSQDITVSTPVNDGITTWDGEPAVYDHWQCLNVYHDEPGVVVLPTSWSQGTNAPVTVSSAQMILSRKWAARRAGAPPRIPTRLSADPNWVYIGGEAPQLRELQNTADGVSVVYEVSGVYNYAAIDVSKVVFVAEIPPTFTQAQLTQSSVWANQPPFGTVPSGVTSIVTNWLTQNTNSIPSPPPPPPPGVPLPPPMLPPAPAGVGGLTGLAFTDGWLGWGWAWGSASYGSSNDAPVVGTRVLPDVPPP